MKERSSWQQQEKGSSISHLTMQPCKPPSLSVKPAGPMLTSLTKEHKMLSNHLGSGPFTSVSPSGIPESHPLRGEAEAAELLRRGSGINPPPAPGTWTQLPDGD